jgi:heterodisulfide reductase subunit C
MKVEHTLEVTATCPIDDRPDVYRCTIRARRVITVESILDAVRRVGDRKLYQEELTQELHRAINCEVETIGWHSGVRTRVVCGGES